MRISVWSSDVCSSVLLKAFGHGVSLFCRFSLSSHTRRAAAESICRARSIAVGGGAAQPVVDRPAEALLWDRRHRDPDEVRPVEFVQAGEEPGSGLDEVAGRAEIQRGLRPRRAEAEQGLSLLRRRRVPAHRQVRRVVARHHARRFRRLRIAPRTHEGAGERSEEHTSELQSLMRTSYAVFCLKKKITYSACKK